MLQQAEVAAEERSILDQVHALPDDLRKRFYACQAGCIKDPDTYAVLNWLFILGLHHFYLGQYLRGGINFAAFLFSALSLLIGLSLQGGEGGFLVLFGLILFGVVFCAELWCLFRSQVIVQAYNNRQARLILETLTHDPE